MYNKMKRAVAAVLLICLLVPMVPLATVNGTGTEPGNEEVYNFDLGSTDLASDGASFATLALSGKVPASINDYYESNTLNWKYAGLSDGHTLIANFGGSIPGKDYKWTGLRVSAKAGSVYSLNYYVAFMIRSPGDGEYYLTVNYQTHRYGASAGSVYVLPASTTDIPAAIANHDAITVINYDNQSTSAGAALPDSQTATAPITCTAGAEYLLVFTVDQPSKANYGYLFLDSVKLTHESRMPKPEEAPQLDQAVYDFILEDTDLTLNGGSFATANLTISETAAAVSSLYKNGSLNWKYHSKTAGTEMLAYFGGQSGTKDYKWDGLRVYCYDGNRNLLQNYYLAMTIQSPGTGDYQVTVDYMVHRYGGKGKVYILPGDTADVATAIKNGKAVGTLNYDNGSTNGSLPAEAGRTTFSGTVPMEKGAEYIVVFESTEKGRNNAYLFLSKLTLTKSGIQAPDTIVPERVPEPEPIPEGSIAYDMDLADTVTGIYKGQGKKLVLEQIEDINRRYAAGSLNWGYAAHNCLSDASMSFLPTGGMTIYSYEMEWIAIKIKSPGAGLHTITLNHGISGNGAIGAVYILPADTTDIEKAMDPTNRVGKINYYNDSGATTVTDGLRTVVGTWEFGSDDEYIVVFEAYQRSPYQAQRGYMFISQLIISAGATNTEAQQRRVNSIVVDAGPVNICEATLYGTTLQSGGSYYMFTPIEGKKVLAYNMSDKCLEYEISVPFTITRGMLTDKNGIIWMVGDKPYIFRYDPVTQVGERFGTYKTDDLAPGATSGFDLVEDEEGYLYFGTYNTGAILKFDPSTGKYSSFGIINEDAVYPCGMAVRDGYLYSGIYGDRNTDKIRVAEAVKIDTATGEVVARVDLDAITAETTVMYRGAGLAGDLFLLGGEGAQKVTIAIDINTMELVELNVNGGINYGVTEELNGKVYFVVNGRGLYELDIATREAKAVPGLENLTVGVRCGKDNFVNINDPVYPGWSIATYSTSNAMPRVYNLEKGNVGAWGDWLPANYGNPTTIRPLISGLPGSNELIIGAYNSDVCAVFNTEQGKVTHTFEATASQTDAILWYEGVLYTGNYNTANLTRVNMDDPNRNVVLLSLKNKHKQARIHTLTAGDGKVFAGTTPDRYEYGGCIAWVDVDTLEYYVERNVVQDQTINCLVYHDGYLYGTTSVAGGSGSAERTDLSAKLFVYDVANQKKVAEVSLEDVIPGLATPISFIAGIAADPNIDENGKLWGLVSETLFSFHFDKTTGKITVKEELSYNKTAYTGESGKSWFPRTFIFDEEGYLYLAFDDKGGMRKINTANVEDNTRIMPYTPMFYAVGPDGNIYYIQDQSLLMYPLNVTDADWETAEQVDALLAQLEGETITLQHGSTIADTRQTYDALSWKHKALVQNLESLEFAEVDLLECKIAAIGAATLDKKEMVNTLKAQYDALPERLQRYVKNYAVLQEAYFTIKDLLDTAEAAKIQKLIDSITSLGTITLEQEESIKQIREAYNALTASQKQLVNPQLLLDAEAKIRKLRDEKIEYLKQLIAGIGEVTLEDEAVITEAMEIWNWLYLDEREQVDTIKLNAANKTLIALQKEAAAAVDALILAIGDTIDRSSKDAIEAARKAYDALTPGSKQYVTQLTLLEEAEAIYAGMFPLWAIILIAVGGVLVLAGGAVATVLILKKKKAAAAEESTAEPEA